MTYLTRWTLLQASTYSHLPSACAGEKKCSSTRSSVRLSASMRELSAPAMSAMKRFQPNVLRHVPRRRCAFAAKKTKSESNAISVEEKEKGQAHGWPLLKRAARELLPCRFFRGLLLGAWRFRQ